MNLITRLSCSKGLKALMVVLLLVPFGVAHAGSWSHETIGGLDTYLYVPTTTPATMINGKRALMVSLHGCLHKNWDIMDGGNWPDTADAYGMVVATPQASGSGFYGVTMGCWDFYGMSHTRTNKDSGYLLDLVSELLGRPALNIDPNQVYLAGLSSGGGEANLHFCMAPDVWAGIGVNAGPAPGSNGLDLSNPSISVMQGVNNCNTLAQTGGDHRAAHQTQLWNTVHGTADGSVSVQHAHRDADIAAAVYHQYTSLVQDGYTTPIPGNGTETLWRDDEGPRVSKLIVQGMGHAWPAGAGSGGSSYYVDHAHVNYPAYLTDFFFSNNRRVNGGAPPPFASVNVSSPADGAILSGLVTIMADATQIDTAEGVEFFLNGVSECIDTSGPYTCFWDTTEFSDGNYSLKAVAVADSTGEPVVDDDTVVTVDNTTPPHECSDWYDSNFSHVVAGRAHVVLGLTYANGSNQNMGLYNVFIHWWLREVSPGYYEIGQCQ